MPYASPMILVKLGGSVITDKSRYRALRRDVLRRLVREMGDADVVVVHGAGSFGHVMAKRYGIANGYTGPEQFEGLFRVHMDVMELNRTVMEALAEGGRHPISFPPHAIQLCGERPYLKPVELAVSLGLTPVLFGDIALSRERGFCIVSGDDVMVHLARELKPEAAIFVSDVDGIFTRPPGEEGARLIPVLENHGFHHDMDVADVTGGIAGKVAKMREIARMGVRTLLINGNVPGRLENAIKGENVKGTVIL